MEGAPIKKTPPALAEILAVSARRTVAPDAARIGGTTVSVETARVGPVDRQPKGDYLSLGLRITNVSQKPIHHHNWSRPGIAVILRDHNGAFYNRVPAPDDRETAIDPGLTIAETLVFEATPAGATLDVDLPVADGGESFRFRIPFQFVQRPRPFNPPPKPTPTLGPTPKPAVAAKEEQKKPAAPPQVDPEKDEKLRATLTTEYRAGKRTIERRALGMSFNEAARYKRIAPKDLLKSLAEKHHLQLEQVRRIIGAE